MPERALNNIDIKSLSANYFELLNLPAAFNIDKKVLRKNYKALMSICHPDRFVAKSDGEKSAAVLATAHVTQAFNTLKSPPQRASYLLELLGYAVNFNASLSTDTQFLMEQLELRESLEKLVSSKDPDAEIQALMDHAGSLQTKEGQSFQAFYEELGASVQTESQESLFQNAHDSVLKLRFLEKFFEEIDALQHKLLD